LNFVIQVVIRTEYDLPERPMFPDTLPDLIRRYTESPLFKRCVGGKELALWWSEIERLLIEYKWFLKHCGCISIDYKHGDREPFVEGYVLYIYKSLSPTLWNLAVMMARLKAPGRCYRFLIWRGRLILGERPSNRLIGPLPRC